MSTFEEVAKWAVAALGTGGVGKFLYDMVSARQGGKKSKAEGAVILVDSASNYAQGLVERLDRVTDEMDEIRRTSEERNRRQDAYLRAHSRWDFEVLRLLDQHVPGVAVPEPPPLYLE